MDFSHKDSWNHFEKLYTEKLSIQEAWTRLIDFHEQVKPKPYWGALRQLDIVAEQEQLVAWVEQIVSASPISKKTIAIWIGITKIWDEENEREYYAIYLVGSDKYTKNNTDWALEPTYEPEHNYGIVKVLSDMDVLIRNDETDYTFLDWLFPIAYIALTLEDIINRNLLSKALFLNGKDKLYISTGYEEGDSLNLSCIE